MACWGPHVVTVASGNDGRGKEKGQGELLSYAFPDFAGVLSPLTSQREGNTDIPDWLRAKSSETLGIFQLNSIVDCGRLLLTLGKEGPMRLLQLSSKLAKERGQIEGLPRFLKDAKYVSTDGEEIRLNYPVFTARDKRTSEAVCEVMSEVVQKEALDCFESLGTELGEITPMKRGIDPREVYTDIWHWIFGQANRIMTERGFMFEPTGGREREGRYIAWVEEGRNHALGPPSPA